MAPLSYLTFESRHLSCNLAPDRRVSYIFWASLWISYICSFATDYARPAYLKSQQYITISCRIISYQIKSDHYLSYRIALHISALPISPFLWSFLTVAPMAQNTIMQIAQWLSIKTTEFAVFRHCGVLVCAIESKARFPDLYQITYIYIFFLFPKQCG